jgi:hypothetical protein
MLKCCVGLYAMRPLFEATFNPYLSECHHRAITIRKNTVQHDSESSSLTAASWRPPFCRPHPDVLPSAQPRDLVPVLVACSLDSWEQLSGQLQQLAEAASSLPWEEKQRAEAVLAAWGTVRALPRGPAGMVRAMQAARDGWRPWALGTSKAWLPLEIMLEEVVEGKRLPHTTTADAVAGEGTEMFVTRLAVTLRVPTTAFHGDVFFKQWAGAT